MPFVTAKCISAQSPEFSCESVEQHPVMIDTPDAEVRRPLGRVVATERRPNTPHEFHFWTALDANIGIGSYEALLAGEFDVTSDVVRRVTGTPAESPRAFVEGNPERFARLGTDARRARTSGS